MRACIATLIWLCSIARAHACECSPMTPEEAYAGAAAVFEGRVLEIEDPGQSGGPRRIVLSVVQAWKGVEHERFELITAPDAGLCGVAFAPQTSWLVYAGLRSDGQYEANVCTRTRPIDEADSDLAALGAGVVPVDVRPEDEVEPAAPRAPRHGGCASCAAAPPRSSGLAILVALLFVSSCRSRSRRAAA